MGWITDILKEVPLSAVLRERLAEAEVQIDKLRISDKQKGEEIANLKATLEQKNAEIELLKQSPMDDDGAPPFPSSGGVI